MTGDRIKLAIAALVVLVVVLAFDFLSIRMENSPDDPTKYFTESTPFFQDEIDINWISKQNYQATATVWLTRKKWRYFGAVDDPNAETGIPETVLTDEQTRKIGQFLAKLPRTDNQSHWKKEDYKKEYHVAFYSDDKLVNLHYPKDNPPSQFTDLLKFLNLADFYK
jgi:hypothetical protein